jgi:hypothetical protein
MAFPPVYLDSVKIDVSEAHAMEDFLNKMGLSVPERLAKATKGFAANPNLSTQNELRLAVCEAFATLPLFKDKMFDEVRTNSEKVLEATKE